MFVSCLINNYNNSKYIEECILSVLEQELAVDELIIVDDGSTDDSVSKIKKVIEDVPYARLVTKTNGGQWSCVAHGIKESKGEILTFLDGDDTWKRDHINNVVKVFCENSSVGMCYTACEKFGDEIGYYDRGYSQGYIGSTRVLTASGCSYVGGVTSSLAVRRAVIGSYVSLPDQIVQEWRISADNILVWLSSLLGVDKYALPQASVNYRIHSSNATKGFNNKNKRIDRKVATARFFEYMKKQLHVPQDFAKLLADEYRAQPDKTKALKKEYLRALRKSGHDLSASQRFENWIRIQLGK